MNITTAVKRRQTFIVVQVRFPVGPSTLFVVFFCFIPLLVTTPLCSHQQHRRHCPVVFPSSSFLFSCMDGHLTLDRKMPVKSGQISPSKGWVSIDRSIKAALLGTTPRPKAKSSTNDFVFSRSNYGYQSTGPACITDGLSLLVWLNHLSKSWVYCCLAARKHRRYRCKSGRDSDLEAFSLYPSDGSLAPLAFRPST
jgi:hypothetical protein